jgi:hypothetical protein
MGSLHRQLHSIFIHVASHKVITLRVGMVACNAGHKAMPTSRRKQALSFVLELYFTFKV